MNFKKQLHSFFFNERLLITQLFFNWDNISLNGHLKLMFSIIKSIPNVHLWKLFLAHRPYKISDGADLTPGPVFYSRGNGLLSYYIHIFPELTQREV